MSSAPYFANLKLPDTLPENVFDWTPQDVEVFLRANQNRGRPADSVIQRLLEGGVNGMDLCDLADARMLEGLFNFPLGQCLDLAKLVTSLKETKGLPLSDAYLDQRRPRSPTDDGMHGTKRRREALVKDLPIGAPSSLAVPARFAEFQRRDCEDRLACNRPASARSTPVTLLHPVFGQFIDDCKSHQPTSQDNVFVSELASFMSGFHSREVVRASEFRSLLYEHYQLKSEDADVRNITSSKDRHTGIGEHCFFITEPKDQVGSEGADPYLQAVLHYARMNRDLLSVELRSVLPCLQIYCFGACVGFAGSAASSDKIHTDILGPIIPLFWQHYDAELRAMAARFFGAFKKAVDRLREYYSNLDRGLVDHLDPAFPYKCDFLSRKDGSTVRFTYNTDIQPRADRLMFFGRTVDSRQRICIKYTRRYCVEAHLYCASVGHAPMVLGYEVLPGGWHMVVMEEIQLGPYGTYSNRFDKSDKFSPKEKVRPMVEELVQKLHAKGFVHGDIRDTNLLVTKEEVQEVDFKLVDFDWAGVAGEVRYPMNVNHVRISRPETAQDGELVTKEHDIEMLHTLFSSRR